MPFTKGDKNINRKGQPKKKWTWAGLVEKAMEKEIQAKDGKKYQKKEYLADILVNKALKGDVQAIKEIANRIDGKAKQQVDHTTNGESLKGLISIK